MKAFVRFCLVSITLVALAFLCEELRANFFSESDTQAAMMEPSGSLTDPIQSEHSFIKFNTPCLTSPTAEGQTVIRTVTGASGSVCRHPRKADFELKVLEYKALIDIFPTKRSLPTLRKLRL